MFHVVLFQPEIPPNTGNIIRLCANTGSALHLIKPLGFSIDDKQLRRAGLDYHDFATVQQYSCLDECITDVDPGNLYMFSTKAKTVYTSAHFKKGDMLVFGSETRGLPKNILESVSGEQRLRLPMHTSSRSLNLSNTVAVVIYEAWRQLGFSSAG
ncbi:MAG: tRNA (uridine(34)/cytosine(34)/5-carboxymethylaminomethyluridine(34)-2'-O)-methyltransferase TrmL [Gammaproteobacteria bacterium]|nr:tRNA (uridine(34)/cytosine(34)/5-carboxymethylaminomethyluridine(34)-2'-O)-methyltransferase TrmL [Gammaproteobacteria bacterium]